MTGKPLREMTLDELFEFEATHSFNIGRRVVSDAGFKRHAAGLKKDLTVLAKGRKRRNSAKALAG